MDSSVLEQQVLATWRRHNEIQLYLVREIPDQGFLAVPSQSRGRDVARQLEHLNQVRLAWMVYFKTGERERPPSRDKNTPPVREDIYRALEESGRLVEEWLQTALVGEVKVKMFGDNPIRWMGYLIAHESHHRGQIMLALKQNGMRLPEKVALQGLWVSGCSGNRPETISSGIGNQALKCLCRRYGILYGQFRFHHVDHG